MSRRDLSLITMRKLMLQALSDDRFINYGGAHKDNLFFQTELEAIKLNTVEDKVNKANTEIAWGSPSHNLFTGQNTNFTKNEIEKLWESFDLLVRNGVIGEGWYRNSSSFPYFHVTEHGRTCIEQCDILPYDMDGYINNIKSIDKINEWVEFYIIEALRCFNANAFNSSVIMIGLASEKLAYLLIEKFSELLGKYSYEYKKNNIKHNGNALKIYFDDQIKKKSKVSSKYGFFNHIFTNVNIQDDISRIIDAPARRTFGDYIRINRNEVCHPSDVIKDETSTMLLLISFLKYCDLLTNLLNKMDEYIHEKES